MEITIIIASILVILGVIGSIIPALPGPVFGFIGLFLLYFAKPDSVSISSLIIFGSLMVILILIDYLAPIIGAKFSGSSKSGLWGSVAGMILGAIFFPPMGIFIGAFFGAYLGELYSGKDYRNSLKAGIGTILGSFSVIIIQTIYSLSLAIYFAIKLFN